VASVNCFLLFAAQGGKKYRLFYSHKNRAVKVAKAETGGSGVTTSSCKNKKGS